MDFMVCLIKSGDFLWYTLVLLSFSPPSCLLSCSNLVWDLQKQTNNKICLMKQQVSMWNFHTYFPLGFWLPPPFISVQHSPSLLVPIYSVFPVFYVIFFPGDRTQGKNSKTDPHTQAIQRYGKKISEKKKLCVFCNCPVSNTNPNQCLRYSMKN